MFIFRESCRHVKLIETLCLMHTLKLAEQWVSYQAAHGTALQLQPAEKLSIIMQPVRSPSLVLVRPKH